ncbi:Transcriptional activator spt7 [Coemansia sp. RSA 1972]|nr:Transcriptional activator spt7 [Coemansia sp. RSA 1972]
MAGDFSADWTIRSFRIAQRLHERGEWASYLTDKELPWLKKALETQELWERFISPSPDQWRLRALPTPAFEPRQGSEPEPTNKRPAPADDNSEMNSSEHKSEKRARTGPSAMVESDDDVLSVLSGSDIDMAMWSAGPSLASNAVSPEPTAAEGNHVSRLAPGDMEAAERSLVCAMAGFRARSTIFEHYIAVLCDTGPCSACTDTATARADISYAESALTAEPEQATNGTGLNGINGHSTSAKVPVQPRHIEEDDDYDDDDDDEGGTETDARVYSGTHHVNGTSAKDSTENKDGTETKEVKQRIVIREVYHTLDEIDDMVHEQMEHESQVKKIKDIVEQRAAEPKDMLVNKIGALQNMKNLAQFIDNHRDSVSMSTRELSNLLSEVRPKRSKWANDRRVGQVELYEALEHALNELKAMGEAVQPFLNQVKRKDAPDYYKVIKHPMDLAAMAKNLKSEAYNSKRQFADHLQLIRDNCYTYNTEPGNYYRKSADALLAKAKLLIEAAPDVVVRDKGSGDDAHTEYGDESGTESQSARYGPREGSFADDGTPAPGSVDCSVVGARVSDEQTVQGLSGAVGSMQLDAVPAPRDASAVEQNILRAMSAGGIAQRAVAELADGYERSLADKLWRSKARQQLREYTRQIGGDHVHGFGEHRATVRTGDGMRQFLDSTHEAVAAIGANEAADIARLADTTGLHTVYALAPGDAAEARRRNDELDEARREWLKVADAVDAGRWTFIGECETAAGISQPEALEAQAQRRGVVTWLNDDCEKPVDEPPGANDEQPSIEAYACARFPDNKMWRLMADNLERLRSIRQIDSKIWAAKLNIPIGYLQPGDEPSRPDDDEEAERALVRNVHGDYARQPDPNLPLNMNAQSARQLLHRTSAFMLSHVGFDTATASAMSCLGEFVADFMRNLGRTLRTYSDQHGRTMSAESIVAHTLHANGTEELADLEYYARGEIARYGNKLGDLHKKLTRAYQEVMSEDRPDAAAGDAELEQGDAFVTGNVGGLGDLGDDFFGFKELGLDKELGIDHINVPQRLWHGRSAAPADAPDAELEQLVHPMPPPWPPVSSAQGQIGLLAEFIAEKLLAGQESNEAAALLVEDENQPLRQRYGASRPKAPVPNCLTHPRTHMHVGSGQVVERAAKKRPSKTTKKKAA